MSISLSDLIWISEKRKNLLLLLNDGPQTMDHISKSLNISSHSMAPQIKILKDEKLICKMEKDVYKLTDIGEIIVKNMQPLLDTLSVIEEEKQYWEDRDFSKLPKKYSERIGELGNYMILEPDMSHLFDLPIEFTENLKKSKSIHCFISYYHPIYIKLYFEMIEKDIDIIFLFTPDVFSRIQKEWKDKLKKIFQNCTFYIYKKNECYNINQSLGYPSICITDSFAYFFFFNKQSTYDNRKLISFEKSAISWGLDLFNHYIKESEKILEKDLDID